MDRAAALKLAQDLVDYRATSMVAGGRQLAQFMLDESVNAADACSKTSARVAELEEQCRILREVIDEIAVAEPDARDQAIAAAVTARRACQ